jgi:hypothetical protein
MLISSRGNTSHHGLMVELAYTLDLKSNVRKDLRVRVPLRPLSKGLKILRSQGFEGSSPSSGTPTGKLPPPKGGVYLFYE